MEKVLSFELDESIKNVETHLMQWSQNSLDVIKNDQEQHQHNIVHSQDRINDLEKQIKSLENILAEKAKSNQVEQEKVESLQNKLKQLQMKEEELPNVIQQIKKQQNEKESAIRVTKNDIDQIRREKEYRITELTKGVLFFKQRLGLDFHIQDGLLCVIFRHLDHAAPKRKCSFTLSVNENGKYQMAQCEPVLVGVDKLITQLNNCNDFSWFVQVMRRCFKALLSKKHEQQATETVNKIQQPQKEENTKNFAERMEKSKVVMKYPKTPMRVDMKRRFDLYSTLNGKFTSKTPQPVRRTSARIAKTSASQITNLVEMDRKVKNEAKSQSKKVRGITFSKTPAPTRSRPRLTQTAKTPMR